MLFLNFVFLTKNVPVKQIVFCFLSMLLLTSFHSNAQSFIFRNYSQNDGLPSSTINCISQTSEGYLWVGTQNGLARFNGKFFSPVYSDSLSQAEVFALFKDKNGVLWVGYKDGSIFTVDGINIRRIYLDLPFQPETVFDFFSDSEGSLWISTLNGGVLKIKTVEHVQKGLLKVEQFRKKDGLADNVFQVFEDQSGMIWLLTDLGLKQYSSANKSFSVFFNNQMPSQQVTSICQNKNGAFFFSTDGAGVVIFNPKNNSIEFINTNVGLPTNRVKTSFIDHQNNLWVDTWEMGVVRYDGKNYEPFTTKEGLAGDIIKTIFQDRENNLWMGTKDFGISCFTGKRFSLISKTDNLASNTVNTILKDNHGKYWMATKEGIAVLEKEKFGRMRFNKSVSLLDSLITDDVVSLALDNNGNILAGTKGGGAALISSSSGKVLRAFKYLPEKYLSSVLCDKDGIYWFACISGIARYDYKNSIFLPNLSMQHKDLPGNDVACLFRDKRNNIWIGIRGKGLVEYNYLSKKLIQRGGSDGLFHLSPVSMCEDKEGTLWVGTTEGGLYSFDGTSFTHFGMKNGLPSENISFVAASSQNILWIGTNKGLSKFLTKENKITSYNIYDGLASNETRQNSSFIEKDGTLWFGTINGAVRYSPEFDIPNFQEPITQITRFKIGLGDADLMKDTVLNYRQRDVSFEFSGLTFSGFENVRYTYKLEGFEEEWHPASIEKNAIYTNLSHGNYTLLVKASNSEGIWNKEPVSFHFIITPPWYLTKSAYALYLVIIIGGPFGFVRLRTRKLILDKEILEQQVKERTMEIEMQNKQLETANEVIVKSRDEIAGKNKDITDSIVYAKRIQNAILPVKQEIERSFPDSFVLYKPRDIVSGDFYWFTEFEGKDKLLNIIVCADCTGHGVPGALLAMIGNNMLNQIIIENEIFSPAEILFQLNNRIKTALKQAGSEGESHDGMDISLCTIDIKNRTLIYAGANRPVYFFTGPDLQFIPGDKVAIAGFTPDNYKYKEHSINTGESCNFYLFTDGYADQFGGENGKKFMQKRFKELLASLQKYPMKEQNKIIDETIESWKGTHEQVDDITVLGIKF